MVRRGIVMSAVVIVLTAAAGVAAGDVHYFAEGALGFFRTDIGLINPSTTDTAHVQLTYVTEDGQRVVQQVTLGPMQRQTISVNEAMAGFGGGVSTIVESDRPIGADRFMEWGNGGYGSSLSGSVSGAMDIRATSAGMGDAEQLCLDFGGGAHPNTLVPPLFGTEDIYLWRQYDAMVLIPGYTGAPNDYFAVSQFLASRTTGRAA